MSFLNLLRNPDADERTQLRRINICLNVCKDLYGNSNIYSTGQCKDCLCFVKQKVKYKNEQCPRMYW